MRKVFVCVGSLAVSCIAFPQGAYANQPCSSISNPTTGTICFYDHPWNVRQRDEGGWKDVEFITERASPGWVIDSFQVIRSPGGHGTVEEPNCSFVSGSGSAEISSTTTRSRRSLSEVKAKLESKLSVPIKGLQAEVRNEIDALNREIQNLDQVESSYVGKGSNEALKCKARTYVKCEKWLGIQTCGQGAAASGNVRIFRRYLANPVELMARAQEREANANKLIAKIDQQPASPVPQPSSPIPVPNNSGIPPSASASQQQSDQQRLWQEEQERRRREREDRRAEERRRQTEMNASLINAGATLLGNIFSGIGRNSQQPAQQPSAPAQPTPYAQADYQPQQQPYTPQPVYAPQPFYGPQPQYTQPSTPTAMPYQAATVQPGLGGTASELMGRLGLAPDPTCSQAAMIIRMLSGQTVCAYYRPPYTPGRYFYNGSALIPER